MALISPLSSSSTEHSSGTNDSDLIMIGVRNGQSKGFFLSSVNREPEKTAVEAFTQSPRTKSQRLCGADEGAASRVPRSSKIRPIGATGYN